MEKVKGSQKGKSTVVSLPPESTNSSWLSPGKPRGISLLFLLVLWTSVGWGQAADRFAVATYNLENYIDGSTGNRPDKPEISRKKIRESILALRPDVLGLQEIGSTNALLELRSSLRADGLDYPHWEHVSGFDTNIFVAVLSRFPIVRSRPHTQDAFLLNGRRLRLTRGIAEMDIQVSADYQFTLFVAHLKSRRPSAVADESDLREQEALVLREKIDARLAADPNANVVVLGDLNDVKDSRSTRAVIGKGRSALVDTRPAERNGDTDPGGNARSASRQVTWTHFYAKEDTYSRVDYIFLSRGMAREWEPKFSYVGTVPNWGLASDHRPVLASFTAQNR